MEKTWQTAHSECYYDWREQLQEVDIGSSGAKSSNQTCRCNTMSSEDLGSKADHDTPTIGKSGNLCWVPPSRDVLV